MIEELKRSIKKENLLVFNVKEGWGPLCKFLGVPEPKQPFPNLNSREFFQKKYVEGLLAKKRLSLISGSQITVFYQTSMSCKLGNH